MTAQRSNSNTVWFNFQTYTCMYIYIYIYTSKKWIMRIKGTLFRTKRDQGKAGVKFESCYF